MAKPTILVVDDERLIRWSLTKRLKAEGYEVLEAETGREALDRLDEGVDLVLLDYKLPDIDGVTVLRRIKEHDQDILVILLTAYATVETAVEAMKIGAYHFANKPFELEELIGTVERALVQPDSDCRRLRRDGRAAEPGHEGGGEPCVHGPADRRERDGQGPRREGASLFE
jgi:two-component system response regulator AtoC